jgi:hypothetical protein
MGDDEEAMRMASATMQPAPLPMTASQNSAGLWSRLTERCQMPRPARIQPVRRPSTMVQTKALAAARSMPRTAHGDDI